MNSLVKLQQMFRIAEIELGMENTIGITLETGVGVQSAILHVCPELNTLVKKKRRTRARMESQGLTLNT